MLGVMSKVIDTLLMCLKAYCHKGWLLEHLCVGEYSPALNLQFLHTSTGILFQSINVFLLILGCKIICFLAHFNEYFSISLHISTCMV